MIDLFAEIPEGTVIGLDEFKSIAEIRYTTGGEAFKVLIEARARKAAETLIMVDPNNVGAVAQLQARVSEGSYILDLLNLDTEIINEQIEAAAVAKKEEKK
jgi:hypothetical protein